MLNVSNAFNEAFKSSTRQVLVRVTMKDVVYTNNDVFDVEYVGGSITGETFNIGSVFSNSIKITFTKVIEAVKQLDKIKLEFGIVLADGSKEFVSMGYFFVDKYNPDRNSNRTIIESLDQMTQLERVYKSELTYPARIKDVALEIANLSGSFVDQASFERLSTSAINKIEGKTYRQAIGLIAQFAGGFAIFDRDGKLSIRTLSDPNFSISTAEYFSRGLVKNETMYTLGGISCKVTTKNGDTSTDFMLQSGSPLGNQIVLENSSMTQILLDGIYQQLKNTNYYPYTLSWRGNPALEAGDWISMSDTKANSFKMPNLTYKLSFSGGLKATSSADTSSVSQASASYRGPINQQLIELQGWKSAAGGWTYTDTTEPSTPKEGDVWFKPNGPDTETLIYEGGKWVFQTSTAGIRQVTEEMNQAQKDIVEAKKAADDAVDKANQNIKEIGELDVKLIDTKTLTDKALADVNKIASENKVLVDKAQVDATKAIDDAKTAYDKAAENSGKIVIVNQDIDKIKGEITQKVSQTDFDKSLGRINQAESSITQNANAITQKVSSIDVENILTGKAYATKSEVVQTSNSLTSTIAGVRTNIDALGTNLAYAYSADGTNGFTTVYPNLNLFKNTKTQSYTSTGTATNNSSPFYALDGITANEFSNKTIQISYDFTILNSVGTWSGTIRPTAGIGGDNQPVSNTKLTGSYVGSLRTYDVTSQAFSIIVTGLPAGTIVRIDNLKAEFGGTVKQWMPSKTEVKPSDYPSYVGRALKYSTKPSDYKWEIDSGYTDAKTDVQQTQISQMSQDLNGFKTTVSSTYLSSTDASNTYPTKDAVSGTYLNKTDASNTYPTKTTVTSQINQKADDITSSVQSWTNGKLNGYSTIQQTNDSITSTIAGVQVEIDKKANQSQVTQLSQDLSGFKTTVSNAYLSKSDASGTYADKVSVASQITQSATQVKQDLQSWTNGQLTSYSTIQSTATSIASAVASKADRTQITQLSDQITSVVESSSQNNLVYNSTLQSGSDGWVMHTGFAQSSARNINGNYIINFSLASNSDNTWYFARSKQVPVGLYKTYSYAASLMRRTDIANSGVFMLGIEGFDSTGKRIEYNTPNYAYQLTDDKWTVVSDSYTFTNPDVKTVCFTLATNGFGHYIACQPILVNDYKVGSFVPDGMDKSQITQLSTDINLRVSKGDVTSQINIEAGRTLIDTKQLLLNANTVKFSGSAFIPDAMIQNLTASKINVGTLNGANVNIINLNASNITGGTLNAIDIKGSNITSVGENYTLNQKNGSITWNRNSDGKKVFGIETQVEPSNEGNTVFEVSKKGSLSIFSKTEDVKIYKNLLTFYNNADNGITASSSVDKIFVQGTDNSASRNQTYSLTISESGISYTSSKSTRPTFNFSNFNSAISFLVGDDISSISLIGGVARVKSKYTTISGDFTVTGSKNAIHATRDGVRATPAYETAESYLGDIGSNYTRENCEVWIEIERLFSDTVNTDIAYQVFLQAYDDAKFWVADFKSDKFLIKSDKPLSRFVWEIKAKRRGYESDRLVLQDDFDSEKIEEAWR
ncbi:MAG: gp58-like family protein, partial [Lactococcus sp.]|nr:gp58-like family protein [Lactococcus sp.]